MILLALALAAAQAAPAATDPGKPAAAAPAPIKTADPYKQVCRVDVSTGHRIASRVCHTQYEWDRMEADAKEYTARAAHAAPCGASGGC